MSERDVRQLEQNWDTCKLPLKIYNQLRDRYGLKPARDEELRRIGLPANASATTFRDLSLMEAQAALASLKANGIEPTMEEQPNGLVTVSVPADQLILRAGRKLVTIKSKCGKWAVVARLNCEDGNFQWMNPGEGVKLSEGDVQEFREARACSMCDHNRWRKYLWVVINLHTYKYETLGTTCAVKEFGLDLNQVFGREVKKATRTETERVLDEMGRAMTIERNRERIAHTIVKLDGVFCVPATEVMAELERILAEEGVQNEWAHNSLAALRERPWVMIQNYERHRDTITRDHLSRWGNSLSKMSYRLMKEAERNDPNAPPEEPDQEIEVAHNEGDRIDLEAVYTKRITTRAGLLRHFFTDADGVQYSFVSYAAEFDTPRNEAERASKFEVGDRISVRVTISKIAKDIVWCRMPKVFRIIQKQAVKEAA